MEQDCIEEASANFFVAAFLGIIMKSVESGKPAETWKYSIRTQIPLENAWNGLLEAFTFITVSKNLFPGKPLTMEAGIKK